MLKETIIFLVLFLTSCASYKIPIQTTDHPASTGLEAPQVELSPILDINENNTSDTEETNALSS